MKEQNKIIVKIIGDMQHFLKIIKLITSSSTSIKTDCESPAAILTGKINVHVIGLTKIEEKSFICDFFRVNFLCKLIILSRK